MPRHTGRPYETTFLSRFGPGTLVISCMLADVGVLGRRGLTDVVIKGLMVYWLYNPLNTEPETPLNETLMGSSYLDSSL
jgi:hypothetical protein